MRRIARRSFIWITIATLAGCDCDPTGRDGDADDGGSGDVDTPDGDGGDGPGGDADGGVEGDAGPEDGAEALPTDPRSLLDRFDPLRTQEGLDARLAELRERFAPFQEDRYDEPEPAVRTVTAIEGWRFRLDARQGSLWGDGETADPPWFDPALEDSGWTPVTLPDWAEYGRGWYRAGFHVDDASDGRRRFLVLQDVDQQVRVWVNGAGPLVDHRGYRAARFALDISDRIVTGDNLVAIEISSFWDPLYLDGLQFSRDDGRAGRPEHGLAGGNGAMLGAATIEEVGPVHVQHLLPVEDAGDRLLRGLVVRPRADLGGFSVGVQIRNDGVSSVAGGRVEAAAYPRNFEGSPSTASGTFSVAAGATGDPVWVDVDVADPHVWSPDSPYLYEIELTLRDASGEVLDRVHDRAGLRSLGQTDEGAIVLNGEEVFLRGAVGYADLLQPYPDAGGTENLMLLLRAANLGAVKTASPGALDAADTYGIVVYLDLPSLGHPLQWIENIDDATCPVADHFPPERHAAWGTPGVPDGTGGWTPAEWQDLRRWFNCRRVRDGLRQILITQLHELADRAGNHPSAAIYAPTHENEAFREQLALYAALVRAGGEIDPTRIVVPQSGRQIVPGFPYDASGCTAGGTCWRLLDYHSHEPWYEALPIDYLDGRTLLHPDYFPAPPFDYESSAPDTFYSFWGRYKAMFSELSGVEALPVWETVRELSDAGQIVPPVASPGDAWNPYDVSAVAVFLGTEDADDALFRPGGLETAAAVRYAAMIADRFQRSAGWCFRFGDVLSGSTGWKCQPEDGSPPTLADRTVEWWIEATQGFQADYLRLSVDALRRAHDRVAGYMYFTMLQVLELSFPKSLVDERGRAKQGYFALAMASAPVRVQIRARDAGRDNPQEFGLCVDPAAVDVWLINDTHDELPGHVVHVIGYDPATDGVCHASEHPATVPAFGALEHVHALDVASDCTGRFSLLAILTDPAGRIVDGDVIKSVEPCPPEAP